MPYVAYDVGTVPIMSPYYICRIWRLSEYDVCSIWLLMHFSFSRLLIMTFVAVSRILLFKLGQYSNSIVTCSLGPHAVPHVAIEVIIASQQKTTWQRKLFKSWSIRIYVDGDKDHRKKQYFLEVRIGIWYLDQIQRFGSDSEIRIGF